MTVALAMSVGVAAATSFVGTLGPLWFGEALPSLVSLGLAAVAVCLSLGCCCCMGLAGMGLSLAAVAVCLSLGRCYNMGLAGMGLGLAAGLAGLLSIVVSLDPAGHLGHLLGQRRTAMVFLLAALVGGSFALD